MTDENSDFLFPPRAIPMLRDLRGREWQTLIEQISSQEPEDIPRMALVLLMVRLGGCATCQADSFRAMRGCVQCSTQTIKRFRGQDADLLNLFYETRDEVARYVNKNLKD